MLLHLEVLECRTLPSVTLFDPPPLFVDPTAYDPSHILVRYRDNYVQTHAPTSILPGTRIGPRLDLVPGLFEVTLSPGIPVESALAAYRADPGVDYAQADNLVQVSYVPTSPRFGSQWDMRNTGQEGGKPGADIQATAAWDVTQGNPQIVVAVLDTGIDYTHPDLYQNIWINQAAIPASRRGNLIDVDGDGIITFNDLNDPRNQGPGKITDLTHHGHIDASDILAPMIKDAQGRDTGLGGWVDGDRPSDLIGWNVTAGTNNPMDDSGHGTHVAGTIAARGEEAGVIGVAPHVQIMPVKFLDASGHGTVTGAIAALNYAVAHGARISNNSWTGSGNNPLLKEAIDNARARGHIFVAAAGNNGVNTDQHPEYPGSYPLDNVVSVAATDRQDRLAGSSNYGPTRVTLAAPGVDVLSTLPGGGYGYKSGTSMATPHVSGALALVWSVHPDWTYRQIIDQVVRTVDHLPDLAGKMVSGGRLNVAAAVGSDSHEVAPPRVVSSTPSGPAADALDRVRLVFDRAMDSSTFTTDNVTLAGPDGQAIAINAVVDVDGSGDRMFDVLFSTQTAPGTYTLVIDGHVVDRAGIALAGYQATFTITKVRTFWPNKSVAILPNRQSVSLLNVNEDLSFDAVTVQVDIRHPYAGDLDLRLQAPDGTEIVLSKHPGGEGEDFQNTVFDDQASSPIRAGSAPFAGVYRPEVALANLVGKSTVGQWKLAVEDRGGRGVGRIYAWSVSFVSGGETESSASLAGVTEAGNKSHGLALSSTSLDEVATSLQLANNGKKNHLGGGGEAL
jgi:subtilisin family serine protease/subtilisin-like proprotein convertase family protein